jgi:predicted small integral membrane protein
MQKLAYWSIITEWVMALVCLTVRGALRARGDRRVCCGEAAGHGRHLLSLLYFVGFVAVGGEWFSMWQSSIWNGQQAAQRFLTCAMFVMVVVLLPEEGDA